MASMLDRGLLTGGDGRHDPAGGDGPVGYGTDVEYSLTADGRAFFAGVSLGF